jgi:hypothetical protein
VGGGSGVVSGNVFGLFGNSRVVAWRRAFFGFGVPKKVGIGKEWVLLEMDDWLFII